jgi:hypothetical protein
MKRKMKLFGCVIVAVFAAAGFYLWGLHGGQTGSGIEFVKKAEAAGGKVTNPDGTAAKPSTEDRLKELDKLAAGGLYHPGRV